MHGIGLREPDMTIDARALVEPPIAETGIDSDHTVLRTVGEEVGEIEAEGSIAVVVSAHEAPVYEDEGVTEGAIELNPDSPARVGGRDLELSPVPSHAGFRITPPERFEAVRAKGRVALGVIADERQLDRPVVRKVERSPGGIVVP